MSWHKLNNSELQAMRRMLMLDVKEAAEHIGKCSVRTWQYWESGRSPVPDDVETEFYALIQIRNDRITDITQQQFEDEEIAEKEGRSPETLKMKYYHTWDSFLEENPDKTHVDWRLHQSVVSFIFSEGGNVELI